MLVTVVVFTAIDFRGGFNYSAIALDGEVSCPNLPDCKFGLGSKTRDGTCSECSV